MQQPVRTDMECGYEPQTPPRSRRTKAMAAGVAIVSAGALAITPVMVTPTMPEVRVPATTAVGLSAFQNPLEVWGETFENLAGTIANGRYQWVLEGATGDNPEWVETWQAPLIDNVSASAEALAATLGRSDVQAGLTGMFSNLADPERLLGALAAMPGYAERLSAASQDGGESLMKAFTALFLYREDEAGERLPSVLQTTMEFLAAGEVFKAFSEVNYWFLVDGLSAGRQTQLDVLKIPGDFLAELGLDPLSRILGNSETGNDGLLGRTVIGNFGRALMAPPITAIFQTVEIIDAVQQAVDKGEFDTAASELINAPAKLTNAFLSGYVPGPLLDFSLGAGRGQAFPGIFSPTGPLDFVFNQLPAEIIRGITPPEADDEDGVDGAADSVATLVSATDTNVDRKTVAVTVDTEVSAPAEDVPVTEPVADETPAPADDLIVDEGTAGEGTTDTDAKALTAKDRIKQIREQAAEQRQERAEKRQERAERTRATVDRVRSNIRKGLGISDKSKDSGSDKDAGGQDSGGSESSSSSNSGSTSKSGSDD